MKKTFLTISFFLTLPTTSFALAEDSAIDTAKDYAVERWKQASDSGLALRNNGKNYEAIAKLKESETIARENHLHDSLLSSSLGNIGYSYMLAGMHEEALQYLLQSAPLDSTLFGYSSPEYAGTLALIGESYFRLERFDGARSALALSVRIFSRSKGKLDFWRITALAYYGTLLMYDGAYDEAEKHLHKALSVSEQSDVARSMRGFINAGLGELYMLRGEWKQSEQSYQEAWEFYSQRESDSTGRTIVQYGLLDLYDNSGQRQKFATLFHWIDSTHTREQLLAFETNERYLLDLGEFLGSGNYPAADSVASACLLDVERKFGQESASYINTLNTFAKTYYMAAQFQKEASFLEEAVRLTESVYGQDSPNLLDPLIDLAGSPQLAGQPERALALLKRAALIVEEKLKGEYPRRHALESVMGSAYLTLEMFQESYNHFLRALQATREIFGKKSIESGEALVSLAMSENLAGYGKRTEKHTREALEIFRMYPDTPAGGYPMALSWLSVAYEEQEKWREAIEVILEAVQVKSSWPLIPPLEYALDYFSLSVNYYHLGIEDSALLMNSRYVEQTAIEVGRDSDDFVVALNLQMYGLLNMGDTAQALKLARKRVAIAESYRAIDDPERTVALVGLSNLLYLNDQIDSAVIIADSAYQLSRRISGDDTPETNAALRVLINYQRSAGEYHQAEINAGVYLAPETTSDSALFDSTTIVSQLEVAKTVLRQGKYQIATPLLVELLHAQEDFYGKKSPEVFRTLTGLSFAYYNLSNFRELQKVGSRAIAIAPLDGIGVHGDLARLYSLLMYPARKRGDYVASQNYTSMMRDEALMDEIDRDALYVQAEEAQVSLFYEMRKYAEADSTISVVMNYAETHALDTMLYYNSLIRSGADVLLYVEEYDSARVRYESVYIRLAHNKEFATTLTALTLIKLGEALGYIGEFDSAMSVFDNAGKLIRSDLPIAQPQTFSEFLSAPFSPFAEPKSGKVTYTTYQLDEYGKRTGNADSVVYTITARQFSDPLEESIYLDSARKAAELRADIAAADFPGRTRRMQEYYLSLGKVFEFRSELDSAESYYNQASFVLHNTLAFKEITLVTIEAQIRLANLYLRRNELDLAESAYLVALDTVDLSYGIWAHLGALAHAGLGRIHDMRGNTQRAETEYRAMVTNSEAAETPVALDVAESLTILASFLKRQNKLPEAMRILERAERMVSDVNGQGDLRRLSPLIELYEIFDRRQDEGARRRVKREIANVIMTQVKRKTLIKHSIVTHMLSALERLGLEDEAKRLADSHRAK